MVMNLNKFKNNSNETVYKNIFVPVMVVINFITSLYFFIIIISSFPDE